MKIRLTIIIILMLISLGVLSPLSSAQVVLTVDDIGKSLVCQCGCNAVLPVCPHVECGVAPVMKAGIKDMIGKGMDKDQILQAFVKKYGEQVLSSPSKTGFNLTAWIAPFAALVVGAVALFWTARVWVKRSKESQPEAQAEPAVQKEDPYKKRMEEELRNWKA